MKMFSFRKIFKYIWRFIKPYKVAFFSLFFLATGRIILTSVFQGYLYKNIIDTLNNTALSVDVRYTIALSFMIPMIFGFALSMLMNRYGDYVNFRMITRVSKNVYDFCFKSLLIHSHSFYANNFTGSLVNRVKKFGTAIRTISDAVVYSFWVIFVLIVSSVVTLYFIAPKIGLFFLVWSIIYSVLIFFFVKQKIKLDIGRAEADSKLTGVLSDNLTNILNIKIFSNFGKEEKRFGEVSTFVKERYWKAYKFTVGRNAFQAGLMVIFHLITLWMMIYMWRDGEITSGVFVMVFALMLAFFDRLWDLSQSMTHFMEALTDAKEMVDIFEKEIDIKDPVSPEICKISDGNIEFKNVSFGYINDIDVIKNFNLDIKKGEKVGLVGHSGSGKSTITKLILRFVDVGEGEILIDGQNIVNITQDDLRGKISYVPQESILFHRSLKENIGYSKENPTDEEIIEVSKKAHAHNFITEFPYGYDTLVGERGVKLSGGERQRVAIARAMLKDAPILILDEATSSLDSISEQYIQDAFNELMKGKTTIVIAHRLSTIQKMDRILVLENGEIVEQGTHTELLAKNGQYADLWNHQVGGFIE